MSCNLCGKALVSQEQFDNGYCDEHEWAYLMYGNKITVIFVNLKKEEVIWPRLV